MGQRLVITVVENHEDIAKLYFHWSAYSVSALEETKSVLDKLLDEERWKNIKDTRLKLIKIAEELGGGIDGGKDSDEWKYVASKYPNRKFKTKNINRNYGLIAISEAGMDNMQDWSEGDVTIDLDAEMIYNEVYGCYSSIEEVEEERKSWLDEDEYEPLNYGEDIEYFNYNLNHISFNDIDCILNAIHCAGTYWLHNGDTDEVYELIA